VGLPTTAPGAARGRGRRESEESARAGREGEIHPLFVPARPSHSGMDSRSGD
jgi:hypothetical protein